MDGRILFHLILIISSFTARNSTSIDNIPYDYITYQNLGFVNFTLLRLMIVKYLSACRKVYVAYIFVTQRSLSNQCYSRSQWPIQFYRLFALPHVRPCICNPSLMLYVEFWKLNFVRNFTKIEICFAFWSSRRPSQFFSGTTIATRNFTKLEQRLD